MIKFILGLIVGGAVSVVFMALCNESLRFRQPCHVRVGMVQKAEQHTLAYLCGLRLKIEQFYVRRTGFAKVKTVRLFSFPKQKIQGE